LKTVLFDVDGVLADFILGFTTTAHNILGGISPITTHEQRSWNTFEGMDAGKIDRTWEYIAKSYFWWNSLFPLIEKDTFSLINELSLRHHVVFCTARPVGSPSPQFQTAYWLRNMGLRIPNVILSSNKVGVAAAISADFAIEDNAANAASLALVCQSFLLNRPYNQKDLAGVARIETIDEFLREVAK
jgi:uncharacterized HAD superfamily protein